MLRCEGCKLLILSADDKAGHSALETTTLSQLTIRDRFVDLQPFIKRRSASPEVLRAWFRHTVECEAAQRSSNACMGSLFPEWANFHGMLVHCREPSCSANPHCLSAMLDSKQGRNRKETEGLRELYESYIYTQVLKASESLYSAVLTDTDRETLQKVCNGETA